MLLVILAITVIAIAYLAAFKARQPPAVTLMLTAGGLFVVLFVYMAFGPGRKGDGDIIINLLSLPASGVANLLSAKMVNWLGDADRDYGDLNSVELLLVFVLGFLQYAGAGFLLGSVIEERRRKKHMKSPFDRLNVDRQLACEFLAVFARYEFALKAVGFAHGDDATPSWDRYAKAIDAAFAGLNSPEQTTAIEYLLTQPPKKQVLDNGHLQWRDDPPDRNFPRAQQVLLMVRRVRNNLFHGGKFLPAAGGDRDQVLVNHALVVLRACLPLEAAVAAAFEN